VTLEIALGGHLDEIARVVGRFAEAHVLEARASEAAGELPAAWRGLAELGVLALCAGSRGAAGGLLEMATAMRALGRASFPGPFFATVVAGRLLGEADRERIAAGELVATVIDDEGPRGRPLAAWARVAERFVSIGADPSGAPRARLARPRAPASPIATLGGEPWGRLEVEYDRGDDLGAAGAACAAGDVSLASYLAGAGSHLVELAAAHARTRAQFGRVIGEFQAVAHPLASAAVGLRAAHLLAVAAARMLDEHDSARAARAGGAESNTPERASSPGAAAFARAAAARRSAERAALAASSAAHQTFGAMGMTVEGPVLAASCRIRQWATPAPSHSSARDATLAALHHLGSEATS
jgi:alkylation response protein AidB-like acyl-CoA dehydrogenase